MGKLCDNVKKVLAIVARICDKGIKANTYHKPLANGVFIMTKSPKNRTYKMSFACPATHISTSGKLVALGGRRDGIDDGGNRVSGVDVYANVTELIELYGGIPDNVRITITVEPTEDSTIVDDMPAVVPRTRQNQFSEKKALFSEIYGHTLTESAEAAAVPDTKTRTKTRTKAPTTTKTRTKAAPVKAAKTGQVVKDDARDLTGEVDELKGMMAAILDKLG